MTEGRTTSNSLADVVEDLFRAGVTSEKKLELFDRFSSTVTDVFESVKLVDLCPKVEARLRRISALLDLATSKGIMEHWGRISISESRSAVE